MAWRRVHFGLAVVAGLHFAFLGITGSLLVFHKEIDALLNPHLLARRSGEGAVSVPAVVAAVAASVGPVLRVDTPATREGVFRVQARDRTTGALAEAFVDPGTGRVLGRRAWRGHLVAVVYDLHYALLLGRRGQDIVGIAGLALLVSIASGLYLWWPGRRKVRQALQLKRQAPRVRRLYDIHKSVGLPAAALLAVTAVSGATMAFPDAARRIAQAVLPAAAPQARAATAAGAHPDGPGLTRAIARARQIVPGAHIRRVLLPDRNSDVYRIHLGRPADLLKSGGLNRIAIDAATGQVVEGRATSAFGPADWFLAAQFPLHNGEALGLAGRLVVFVLGLVPTMLYVTGLLLWRSRRRARRRASGG